MRDCLERLLDKKVTRLLLKKSNILISTKKKAMNMLMIIMKEL